MDVVEKRLLEAVLSAWGLERFSVRPLGGGLINKTYLVGSGQLRSVLQQVNPIFSPEVHLDIEAITGHLQSKGLATPRLVQTRSGKLWSEHNGSVYRVQTFVEGTSLSQLTTPKQVEAAAAGVATFHAALADLEWDFKSQRSFAHDTPAHLTKLALTLDEASKHELYTVAAPLAESILEQGARLPKLPELPKRIIHGDLKCQNLMFTAESDRLVALVDLDTLTHGTLAVELGDALRSWCNPDGEEGLNACVHEGLFAAAANGYARQARSWVEDAELETLALATQTIALELAARFCTDVFEECYFGWDPSQYGRRGEHNLIRAESQYALARSVQDKRAKLDGIATKALRAAR